MEHYPRYKLQGSATSDPSTLGHVAALGFLGLLLGCCSVPSKQDEAVGVRQGVVEPPAPPLAVRVELRAAGPGLEGRIRIPEERMLKPLDELEIGPERASFAFSTVNGRKTP